MYKCLIIIFLTAFIFAHSAYAQSFRVISISEDLEAVLVDRETDEEWVASEGDEIEGWTIVEVTKARVVIRKEPEWDESYAIIRTLILPKKVGVMPVRRQ